MNRASGLDLLRAVAIAWVMLFHAWAMLSTSFAIDLLHRPFAALQSYGCTRTMAAKPLSYADSEGLTFALTVRVTVKRRLLSPLGFRHIVVAKMPPK